MVPNLDPKQYWNNWKNDMSLFSATNQKRPYEQLLHNWLRDGPLETYLGGGGEVQKNIRAREY